MTGYGIIERTGSHLRLIDYGCMETLPDRPLPERLLLIHEAIEGLIEEHRPVLVGVERLFFNKNVQTAFAVGQARGVVLLAAAQHGLPVFEYGPHEVKIAVTGLRPRAEGPGPAHGPDRARHGRSCRVPTMPRMPWRWPSAWRTASGRHDRRVIASVEGRVGAISPDSLVIEAGGIGYRVFCWARARWRGARRPDAEAPHPPPGARRPPGALRLPHDRGAGLLRAADHGHGRGPQGRASRS